MFIFAFVWHSRRVRCIFASSLLRLIRDCWWLSFHSLLVVQIRLLLLIGWAHILLFWTLLARLLICLLLLSLWALFSYWFGCIDRCSGRGSSIVRTSLFVVIGIALCEWLSIKCRAASCRNKVIFTIFIFVLTAVVVPNSFLLILFLVGANSVAILFLWRCLRLCWFELFIISDSGRAKLFFIFVLHSDGCRTFCFCSACPSLAYLFLPFATNRCLALLLWLLRRCQGCDRILSWRRVILLEELLLLFL